MFPLFLLDTHFHKALSVRGETQGKGIRKALMESKKKQLKRVRFAEYPSSQDTVELDTDDEVWRAPHTTHTTTHTTLTHFFARSNP